MNLRDASHEQAVETIRGAGDCLDFLVQSGQPCESLVLCLMLQQKRKKMYTHIGSGKDL